MRRSLFAAVALPLLILVGCGQPLKFEKDFTLDLAESARFFTITSPQSEQKLTVTATSTEEPITVFVVLAEDQAAGQRALGAGTKPAKALGGQENAKDISFEVKIPAGKEFVVVVGLGRGARRKTNVKLAVKGH